MSTSCWSHRRVPFGCHQRLDRSNARLPPFPHRLFFGVPGPGPGQKEKEGKVNRRDGISTRDFPRIRSGTHPPPVPVVRVCPWYQPPGRRRSTQPVCWAVQGPKIPRMREGVNVASRGPRVVPWVGGWVCPARLVSFSSGLVVSGRPFWGLACLFCLLSQLPGSAPRFLFSSFRGPALAPTGY